MSQRCFMAVSLALLSTVTHLNGETWESPDGFLAVSQPNASKYPPVKPYTPPQLGRWKSDDGFMTFSVDLVPHIPGFVPSLEGLEHAYTHRDTKVTRLPKRKLGAHEVWTIKTSNVRVMQIIAVIHHDGWFHRVRASGLSSKFDRESAMQFVKSIKLKGGTWTPPTTQIRTKMQDQK